MARAGPARGNGAGNVVAIDLAVRLRLRELARAAIGIRCCFAARRAGSKASIDAIAVAVVGDDEHPPFRLRSACRCERRGEYGNRDDGTHGPPNRRPKRRKTRVAINTKNATMELTLH